MKITTEKVYRITFESEVYAAFKAADDALTDVMNALGTHATLVSPETGECVDLSELPRVCGILSLFQNCTVFEINH